MGIILSKFRKKESTKDVLEKLQNDVISLEKFQKNEQSRKRIVGYIIAITLLLSISAGILYFFYYPPPTLSEKFLYVSQFIAVPVIIIIIKKLLAWYFTWRLRSNDNKLKLLKQKKKKILEEVMETETYKAAKEILEIYAPEALRSSQPYSATPIHTPRLQGNSGTDLRKRVVNTPAIAGKDSMAPSGMFSTPSSSYRPKTLPKATPRPAGGPSYGTTQVDSTSLMKPPFNPNTMPGHDPGALERTLPAGPPMPRLVVPRERSVMDRFIEYIVGDGPTNRFALICRQCESHNGMALKDEFEYLAFRCAYCYYWNPSRKQKPLAPKLENVQPSTPLRLALQKERKVSSSSEEDDEKPSDEAGAEDSLVIEESVSRKSETKESESEPLEKKSNDSEETETDAPQETKPNSAEECPPELPVSQVTEKKSS